MTEEESEKKRYQNKKRARTTTNINAHILIMQPSKCLFASTTIVCVSKCMVIPHQNDRLH